MENGRRLRNHDTDRPQVAHRLSIEVSWREAFEARPVGLGLDLKKECSISHEWQDTCILASAERLMDT